MKAKSVFEEYIGKIDCAYRTGKATEHTYRGALTELVGELLKDTVVLNEPKRIACGAPDLIITRDKLPIAFIEAKDIGESDLDGRKSTGNKEQFDRYKASLDHIAFTDYLDFHFYEKGELVESVRIADVVGDGIKSLPENFARFNALVVALGCAAPQNIKSAKQLAKLMAGKARLLEQATMKLLEGAGAAKTSIGRLMEDFKHALVPDVSPREFADIYAQTITYGMFAARLHDDTPNDFSRYEAAALIPKSNPFLKQLFVQISSGLEDELVWIVDDLVKMFGASDLAKIMKDYGKSTCQSDPMIHFYEDFLSAYDAGLRKDRGVWYTPLPVVKFIVRAVDYILEHDFGLQDGLANRDKVEIEVEEDAYSGKKATKKVKQTVHKVQMLDPATGTGTFLAECVNLIHGKFSGHAGKWKSYVKDDLLPRLNGFEILMASYTMAHVKLDLVLSNTGYTHSGEGRFNIFLTNSLEEHTESMGPLFAAALGEEANAAKFIKRDCPVMVVMGNPPYSVSSQNKGKWIEKLVGDYKKNLKEKKINLDDDYIKFIRLGQYYIDKNGEGVLAYISNYSFLKGITHRQMRKSLLLTFDDIYIVNLHGDVRDAEIAPNGGKDENIFNIMKGVSINIFVKRKSAEGMRFEASKNTYGAALATVHYCDLYGRRKDKFAKLESTDFADMAWQKLDLKTPYYFFVPRDFGAHGDYEKGFGVQELMPVNNSGIQTKRDDLVYQYDDEAIHSVINGLKEMSVEAFRETFAVGEDGVAWFVGKAKKDIKENTGRYLRVAYHPFDCRYTYFTGQSSGWMARPRMPTSSHMLSGNIALLAVRNTRREQCYNYFVADTIVDKDGVSGYDNCRFFPLYLYEENFGKKERHPNFNAEVYDKIAAALVCKPEPEEVFDYIYAVLHTPEYRSKYKEFLKVDFPRIPYPKSAAMFEKLAAFGGELRAAHLLKDKHSQFEQTAAFAVDGENLVEGVRFEEGRVYINETQYFDKVPEDIFTFYIGGYQPAQKWLKDRKGRMLTNDDCDHYQSIILALVKTRDVMQELSGYSSKWL